MASTAAFGFALRNLIRQLINLGMLREKRVQRLAHDFLR